MKMSISSIYEGEQLKSERYDHVDCRKSEGAHYTPKILSDFVAQNIVDASKLSGNIRIADPAIGDGELVSSLLTCLRNHVGKIEVYGFDTNADSIALTRARLSRQFPDVELHLFNSDFLATCLAKNGSDRLVKSEIPEFDLLIANPPYIRTQVLGSQQSQLISKQFGLKGRVDIYQAFLIGMKMMLKAGSVAGVIVSNRFLTTKGSGRFRELLSEIYDIKHIWDFGDTKLFEAAVLPAVMVMSPKTFKTSAPIKFTSIYEHHSNDDLCKIKTAMNPILAISEEGLVKCDNEITYKVKQGNLILEPDRSSVWRLQNESSKKWLGKVNENTWSTFGAVGKIRVGVKTTADKVFIRKDWVSETGAEPELLKPLTTHHVAGRFKRKDVPLKKILYTHQILNKKRIVVDLSDFPKSKEYLENHRKRLSERRYVTKAGRQWYEIWVPQNPSFWSNKKIVFKDIAEQPTFWMDTAGTIINGDCYWFFNEQKEGSEDLLWLVLAVANSRFIEEFYDFKFQNKLYSNRRRFMTQYVEQFPIPDPSAVISKNLVVLAKRRFDESSPTKQLQIEKEIDEQVLKVFGVLDMVVKD